MPEPILHLFCGKIASGKSTLARNLSKDPGTVLISEDVWLHGLYGDQMANVDDFMRCSGKLRNTLKPLVVDLLNAGTSVVLDFAAITVKSRSWAREILDASSAGHQLHVFGPPDAVCLERLQHRNAQGVHPFAVTEAQFHEISSYFTAPQPGEGFTIVTHN